MRLKHWKSRIYDQKHRKTNILFNTHWTKDPWVLYFLTSASHLFSEMKHSIIILQRYFFLGAALLPFFPAFSDAQAPSTYPYVSPTASASGMTTGLENGTTAATMQMMQVRAAAQQSERAAAAAAMARTAEAAIDEQNLKKSLAHARETRRQKMEVAERLKWERVTANNAYKRISPSEMASWKDSQGNIKIGSGLSPEFAQAVREQQMRDAAAAQKQKKGFAPLKKIGNRVSDVINENSPNEETGLTGPKPLPPAPRQPAPTQIRGRAITLNSPEKPQRTRPKFNLPKFGKKNKATPPPQTPQFANATGNSAGSPSAPAPPAPAQKPSSQARATSAPIPASSASARPAVSKKAASVPARSGAELMKASTPENSSVASAPPKPKPSKPGFFSRNKINVAEKPAAQPKPAKPAKPASSPRRFGFKKKNIAPAPEPASIDTGLFPTGAVANTSSGEVIGGYSPNAGQTAPAPASTTTNSNVAMPGTTPPERSTPGRKFTIPKPKIPTPKKIAKSAGSGIPTTTTVNKNGNSFYVVNSSAQFMKYGASRSETTIMALPPGTIVQMTKPGESWASVRTSNGSSGVIETKNLRAASAAEAPVR